MPPVLNQMSEREVPSAEPVCIVCEKPSPQVIWAEGGFQGHLCECGNVYLSPAPGPEDFDVTCELHPESYYAVPATLRGRWLASRGLSGRLLEVGCGHGHFLAVAQRLGFEVEGLEPHPERSRHTRDRLHIPVYEESIEHFVRPGAGYDVVFHVDLMSHFPDPYLSLIRMKELLNPGGCLCFEAGILGDISPHWYRLMGGVHFPQHRWLYSIPGLESLLAKAGLRVRSLQRFGLSAQILLGAWNGLYLRPARRALKRIQQVLAQQGVSPGGTLNPTIPSHWRESYYHLLRYSVGAYLPNVGPQTLLIEAEVNEG